jgi:VanZ family protein
VRKFFFSVVALGWTITITILSFISMKDKQVFTFSFADKLMHAAVYFIFTIVWYFAFSRGFTTEKLKKQALTLSVIFGFLYGILIEILQGTLSAERQGDWQDVVANSVGTIFAIFVIKWFIAYARKLKTEN